MAHVNNDVLTKVVEEQLLRRINRDNQDNQSGLYVSKDHTWMKVIRNLEAKGLVEFRRQDYPVYGYWLTETGHRVIGE